MVLRRHEIGAAQCSDRTPVNGPTGEVLAVGVVAVRARYRLGKLAIFDECFELDQPSGPGAGLTDVRERVLVPVPALLGGTEGDEGSDGELP
jgi:hypothetical protein